MDNFFLEFVICVPDLLDSLEDIDIKEEQSNNGDDPGEEQSRAVDVVSAPKKLNF